MKTVTSQKEFEDALKAGETGFVVRGFVANARENSHVEAWENSHVVAWDYSHVYVYSPKAKTRKGSMATVAVINYPKDIRAWCAMKGIKIKSNRIVLWKTTQKDGRDFYTGKVLYDTKTEIVCPDWKDKYGQECGAGLHLADSPSAARSFSGTRNARLFKLSANINDCVCFPGTPNYPMKIRVKKCSMVEEYPLDYFEEF